MGESPPDVDDLSLDELRKLVVQLLEQIAALTSENAALREEIARLKGLKGRPKLKPSGMEKATEPRRKRRTKRRKGERAKLVIHEERVVTAEVPAGSRFKGYEDFVVQELVIRPQVIRFRRERWLTPDGQTLVAALPAWVEGHFGPALKRYVLAQYHRGQVTVPRLTTQLNDLGVAHFQAPRPPALDRGQGRLSRRGDRRGSRAGLETARWVTVDDTGARHRGMNGVCTQIGNDDFAWFATTRSKSRLNFLALLRAGHTDYVINAQALAYMRSRNLAGPVIDLLAGHETTQFADVAAWQAHLQRLGLAQLKVDPDPVKIATEGALWGSVVDHGHLSEAVIVSDDAGQFNVGTHALCWVHAERLIHKLVGFNDGQRQAIERIRARVWWLYADLKGYCRDPTAPAKAALKRRGDTHLLHPNRLCHARPVARPRSTPTRRNCSAPSNGRISRFTPTARRTTSAAR